MQKLPKAYLRTIHGKLPTTRDVLITKTDFSIGRSSSADLQLEDGKISRLQAMIYFRQNNWYIQDKSSNQNTYVNKKKVTAGLLKNGDVITIGNNEFVFFIESTGENQQELPAGQPIVKPQRILLSPLESSELPAKPADSSAKSLNSLNLRLILTAAGILMAIFIIGINLYARSRFSQGRVAYEKGNCPIAISIFDPFSGSILGNLFPSLATEAKKLMSECNSFLTWQQLIEQGDYATSKQSFLEFIETYPNSPLVSRANQYILEILQFDENSYLDFQWCALIPQYSDVFINQRSKTEYLSLVQLCGKKATEQGKPENAFEYYLEAIHRFPGDPALASIYQELAYNPYSCQKLNQLEGDPVIGQLTLPLIDAYKNCIHSYLEIGNQEEAIRLLSKLKTQMLQQNAADSLSEWVAIQPYDCNQLSEIFSLLLDLPSKTLLFQQISNRCEQEFVQKGDFLSAIRMYENLKDISDAQLLQSYARLLYTYASTFRKSEEKLERLRLITNEKSELLIRNGSLYPVRIALIGEETFVIHLPACESPNQCVDNRRKCTANAPQTTMILSGGVYDVAVLWLNPEPVEGVALNFLVNTHSSYQWCITR